MNDNLKTCSTCFKEIDSRASKCRYCKTSFIKRTILSKDSFLTLIGIVSMIVSIGSLYISWAQLNEAKQQRISAERAKTDAEFALAKATVAIRQYENLNKILKKEIEQTIEISKITTQLNWFNANESFMSMLSTPNTNLNNIADQ